MGAQRIASILKTKGSEIHAVGPDATAYEAIGKMSTAGTGAVLVMEDGHLVGIFSAKDYGARVVLAGKNGMEVVVRDVMTHPVLTVGPDVKVVDGMQIMTARGVRHLPIVEGESLLGIVTLADLARSILADQEFKIEQLMNYVGG